MSEWLKKLNLVFFVSSLMFSLFRTLSSFECFRLREGEMQAIILLAVLDNGVKIEINDLLTGLPFEGLVTIVTGLVFDGLTVSVITPIFGGFVASAGLLYDGLINVVAEVRVDGTSVDTLSATQ